MTFSAPRPTGDKPRVYALLEKQARALLQGETDMVANAANVSALLYHALPQVNWLGFYFYSPKDQQLILGPFQGQVACTRIPVGQGVCGTAFATQTTQRIDNVDEFPGHIACDSASRSEIVVPLFKDGNCFGVLDVDAPVVGRFDAIDQSGLERLGAIYTQSIS